MAGRGSLPAAERRRAPGGSARQNPEPFAQAPRAPQVPKDRAVLVERDGEERIALEVLPNPVDDPGHLGLEGPEETVPDDEDAAVVLVEVLGDGPVVHPMVQHGTNPEYRS